MLLDPSGQLKLIDLGSAKRLGDAPGQRLMTEIGTQSYLPPEQVGSVSNSLYLKESPTSLPAYPSLPAYLLTYLHLPPEQVGSVKYSNSLPT